MENSIVKSTLEIPIGKIELTGDLSLPQQATALVIFAHGSGSSRLSPRNQLVADYLNSKGIATLLFDLLTYAEDRDYANRFNISLLAERLKIVTQWISGKEECKDLLLGYFGASTGAAAALVASVDVPQVKAIVSRGGRPDLSMRVIDRVKAATLLIVGSYDHEVLNLNVEAYNGLTCEKKLEVIPGATHLFPETGAMETVCGLAADSFVFHLHPIQVV